MNIKTLMTIFLSSLFFIQLNGQNFSYDYKGNTLYFRVTDSTAKTCEIVSNPSSYWSDYKGNIEIPSNVEYNNSDYSVTSIGIDAFRQSSISSITLPNGIINIGAGAFNGCSQLKEVEIPSSVSYIGSAAFMTCYSLRSFSGKFATPDNKALIIDDEMVAFAPYEMTEYNVPSNVRKIGEYTFYCSNLTSVTVPSGLTSIGKSAFCSTKIITIDLPEGIIEIGKEAFNGSKLTSITLPSSLVTLGEGVFKSCTDLREFNGKFASYDHKCLIDGDELLAFASYGLTEYEIPESVSKIGPNVFLRCSNLNRVVLPNGLTDIGNDAFNLCVNLENINIPNTVEKIGDYAFAKCKLRETLELPSSVISIGSLAFSYCTTIKSLYIPASLINIGYAAFGDCTSIEEIYIFNDDPSDITLGSNVFRNINTSSCILYVPEGTMEQYSSLNQWKQFENIIEYRPPITLMDGEEYYNTTTKSCDVTYIRNFKNLNWQGLYLPFDLSYEEWSPYVQVAELAGVHMYDDDGDGSPDRTNIEFATVKEGSILPHTPYVVKANTIGEVVFECSKKILSAVPSADGAVSCSNPRWEYVLTGTYVSRTDLIGDGIYCLGAGKFRPNNANIPPYRFYLQMLKRAGGYWGMPGKDMYPMEIEVSIDGECVSDIRSIISDDVNTEEENSYYDILGRRIENPNRGIFIYNGRPKLIK